jgi:uncharacterized membrane protein YjgN (DUF898 family)
MTIISENGGGIIASAPAQAMPPGPAETRLVYDGTTESVLILWLKVLGLNIITLGFYRFWGRTRIRRYLWSHVSLLDERFEYDGTGTELFVRFLVAVVIFAPLLSMANIVTLLGGGLFWARVASYVQFVLLILLSYFAYYAGRRYRMSRTLWRGIRGGLDGSGINYAFRAFAFLLSAMLTGGWSSPWQYVGLWRYEINNAGFGNDEFSFEGAGSDLVRPFAITWFFNLAALTLLGFSLFGVFLFAGSPVPSGHHLPKLSVGWGPVIGLTLLAYLAYVIAVACAYLYFTARTLAYYARNTRFRGLAFSADVRMRDLLWLQLGNIGVMIITFGLGAAFNAHRYVRFFCNNLRIYGVEDIEAMAQEPGRRQAKGGEGLVQLLDTGGFA